METNNVVLSLETYNRLRDDNRRLRETNKELNEKMDESKVRTIKYIIKESEYVDGVVEKVVKTTVENFEDVKEDVESYYGDKMNDLIADNVKLKDDYLALQTENAHLRRPWWKKILNK